jgi:hypothetical protein
VTHTLFGYDRLVTAAHAGNAGIRTGATGRPGGKTHLADSATGKTACGRVVQGGLALVPDFITEDTWAARIALCAPCLTAATKPATWQRVTDPTGYQTARYLWGEFEVRKEFYADGPSMFTFVLYRNGARVDERRTLRAAKALAENTKEAR